MSRITYNHLNLPHTISGTGGERTLSSHTKWLVGEVKRSFRPTAERGAISGVKTLCATAKVLLREISNVYDAAGRKWQSTQAGVTTTYFVDIEYERPIHDDRSDDVGQCVKGVNPPLAGRVAAIKAIYHQDGERTRSSHTKWLVAEVKRNVRTAVKRGAAMESKHFVRQPKCFCGRILNNNGSYEYQYYIKDHTPRRTCLGNVRIVCNTAAVIRSEQHYYPFGERTRSSHTKWLVGEVKRSFRPTAKRGAISGVKTLCATAKVLLRENMEGNFTATGYNQKYRYNGKELYGGLGWYDYGARYYDPTVGRWTSVDPLAEKYPKFTPYAYVGNMPINAIDPDGRKIIILNNVKGTIYQLSMIAATKKGDERVSSLIESQRTYRVKSVFWTEDSGYDHLGVKGDRYTTYYASNPWMPRIGGGAVSGETILGHELDHAYIQPNNKLPTIGVEIEGVRFQNYLTSVFGQGSMRTSYNKYRLKFSTDEKSYNPSGEKLTNFSEDFDKKTDNGDQYLGYSFNLTDNVNGVSSTGFILSVTTADGQYTYRKFDNKKEYDEALKRVQNLPKN